MSQLAEIVHSEVDAARVELDNQSSQIRNRMLELQVRMEELERKQTPQKDGLAFESAMAITSSTDVDVRGALQWHLAEVSMKSFQKNGQEADDHDGNNVLSRSDFEEKIVAGKARLSLVERRLEELESTTAAEHDVIMADVHDMCTLVKTTPLVATPDRGTGVYVPLAKLRSVPGLRPRSRDYVETLRVELTKLHQLFLTKTSTMVSENIQLQKENEGLQREVEALRAAVARPAVINDVRTTGGSSSGSSGSSSGGGGGGGGGSSSMSSSAELEDPMLVFAMDNMMRVMILARIPPIAANQVYEQLLEFSSEWTEHQFINACQSSEKFVDAIRRIGMYTPSESVQRALSGDSFFRTFQQQRSSGNQTNTSSTSEQKQMEKISVPEMSKAPLAEGGRKPTLTSGTASEKGNDSFYTEEMVLSGTAKSMDDLHLGSIVYIKMPGWSSAHKGSVIKIWENGFVDVELSNGKVAKKLGAAELVFGVTK